MKSSKRRRPPISIDFTYAAEWEQLWRSLARAILDEQAERKDGLLSEEHLMELLTKCQPEVESLAKSIQARGPRDERAERAAQLMREELDRQIAAGEDPVRSYSALPRILHQRYESLAADGKLTTALDRRLWEAQRTQWSRWRDTFIPRPTK